LDQDCRYLQLFLAVDCVDVDVIGTQIPLGSSWSLVVLPPQTTKRFGFRQSGDGRTSDGWLSNRPGTPTRQRRIVCGCGTGGCSSSLGWRGTGIGMGIHRRVDCRLPAV